MNPLKKKNWKKNVYMRVRETERERDKKKGREKEREQNFDVFLKKKI